MSLPLVTNALTHGLSIAGYMFVNPGDTLLVPDLYWENYNLIFENGYNAHIQKFNLFDGQGLDLKALESSISDGKPGKKILLLNFPNNPAGYTPTKEEAKGIVQCIEKAASAGNKLVVLIDDAYFGLVYEDGIEHESLFSWLSDLHQNVLAVKLDGPTKEDYVWGFRVGFLTYGIKGGSAELYNALEMKTAGAIRGNVSSVSHPAQTILLQAYNTPSYEQEKKSKYDLLRTRYQAVKKVAYKPEYAEVFKPIPFNSGYFMCVKPAEGIDAEKVRKLLLSDYDTGIINMAGVLRIAFSCVQEAKIPELFNNIYQAAVRVRDGK